MTKQWSNCYTFINHTILPFTLYNPFTLPHSLIHFSKAFTMHSIHKTQKHTSTLMNKLGISFYNVRNPLQYRNILNISYSLIVFTRFHIYLDTRLSLFRILLPVPNYTSSTKLYLDSVHLQLAVPNNTNSILSTVNTKTFRSQQSSPKLDVYL